MWQLAAVLIRACFRVAQQHQAALVATMKRQKLNCRIDGVSILFFYSFVKLLIPLQLPSLSISFLLYPFHVPDFHWIPASQEIQIIFPNLSKKAARWVFTHTAHCADLFVTFPDYSVFLIAFSIKWIRHGILSLPQSLFQLIFYVRLIL